MRNKNKKNSFLNFLFYSSIIFAITVSFIIFLTVKNECKTTEFEITKLKSEYSYNSNIVKELQSNKEYLISEKYINSLVSDYMTLTVPETLLININVK